MEKDALGARMKAYEHALSLRTMPLLPVIARLDGKSFHSWTRGLDKPFDADFVAVMQNTTKELVRSTNAVIGYTQSDEITLVFYSADPKSQIFHDGKIQKMVSVLASMCTAIFKTSCAENGKSGMLLAKPSALFDCRVFQVPTCEEAVNCLIWREQDAVRNSIQALAQSKFSHKKLQNKSNSILQEMLFQEHGINWGEDLSPELKRGTYFRRISSSRAFTTEEIEKLPEQHEARKDPSLVVVRSDVERADFPVLTKIINRVDVIFDGAEPKLN